MSENQNKMIVAPSLMAWADDKHSNYHIEVKLPGVEKESLVLKMHEDSFFLKGETDDTVYIGSYAVCCEVDPKKAKAVYKNGLLKVDVPFKNVMEGAVDIQIE